MKGVLRGAQDVAPERRQAATGDEREEEGAGLVRRESRDFAKAVVGSGGSYRL